ncbi:hemagglutinin repeat-containing protein [Xanthomonas campestris pv. raphani]|uniref:hemagglutinin repeat-containing protein n=1 Tax=Xanthomonas campestris TaxID=339 RepID=UPI002B2357CA|nr:hemagglutinin repeat-containing protein [Xanthomonas campestris]MEA9751064.1 hemagglutinin repeat-containing protein [Xanthomonas campestris pv. raphani]MEA9811342.1 hemagglutinin repeat-containing protein [Xanthomonas campestris pv. raphani]
MDKQTMGMRGYVAEQCKRGLALLLCCTVTWTSFPAWAQVAPTPNPGGQQPGQQVAANGVPVVDIVAPNARGISHNRYSNFNVGPNGLILNNSAQISKTELGGYVAGNNNLQRSGAASLILNEVTSASSRLQGYTEIAGAKAQLVIANPNGISCDGCGFLNTSRVTLTTGTPNLGSDGALNGFTVTGGALSIGSNGLDAFNVDRLDLLSRQLSVGGSIWTKELVATAGTGRINYDGMLLDVLPGTDGGAPVIGIDVAQLGGMYADRIRLIATEAGVGVVSRGTLAAQSGDLQIDGAGQVSLRGTTVARDGLSARAAGDLEQSGVLGSQQGTVSLRGAELRLAGDLVAAGALDAQASGTLTHSGRSSAGSIRLFGSQLNADGSLHTQGVLDLGADGLLRTGGVAYAGAGATLRAVRLGVSGTLQSGAAISMQANDIDALGTLDAATALRVNSTGGLRLAGLAQAAQDADVQAGGPLELQGQLVAGNALSLGAGSVRIAQGAAVSAGGDLAMRSVGLLETAGSAYAGRDLQVQAGALNNAGRLSSVRAAQVTVDQAVDNSGTLVAGATLRVDAAQLDSRGDVGSQTGDTVVRSRGSLSLRGNTVAGAAMTLDAATTADVSGTLSAGQLDLRSGGNATLAGAIQTSSGALTVASAGTLTSSGILRSTGELALQANGSLLQRGQLRSDGNLLLAAAAIDSDGTVDSGGNLRLASQGDMQLAGSLQSAGATALQAGGRVDNRGAVVAVGTLGLDAAALRNAQGAALSSQGDATLRTAGLLDNAGSLSAGGNLQLTAANVVQQGSATAGNALTASVSETLDNTGSLVAKQAVQIDAGTLRSNGQLGSESADVRLSSQGDMRLGGVVAAATELQAAAAGDLQQDGALRGQSVTLQAGRDLTTAGSLQSTNALDLQAQRTLTFAAQGAVGGDARLRAGTLATTDAAVLQSAGAIGLDAAAIDSRGKLDAAGDLRASSQGDLRLAGVAQGGRDVTLSAGGNLENAAQVFAGGDLVAQAQRVENASAGVLAAERDVAVEGTTQLVNAGRVQAGRDLQITTAGFEQTGSASAGAALTATIAGALENSGNLIARDALRIDAGTLRSSGQLGSERAAVSLNSLGEMQLAGVVAAATTLQATAATDLQQAGALKAQSIALQAGRDLAAAGTLQSTSTLDLRAQRALTITGQASSSAATSLTAGTIATGVDAVVQSGSGITLDGQSIDSRGALDAASDLQIRSTGALALAGVAQAGQDVVLTAGGAFDNAAQVVAARDLRLQAASASNAAGGTLGALRDLHVETAGVFDNAGSLHGERSLALSTGALLQRGRLYSGDALSITSQGAFDNSGQLVSGNGLSITASRVSSNGQLGSVNGAVALTSQGDVDLKGVVSAATTLQATAGGDLLQAGTLSAQSVTLNAGRDLSASGTLQSASTLDMQAQRALRISGQAQANIIALQGGSVATGTGAVVKSVGAITLDGAAIDSRGTLDAGSDLSLRSTGDLSVAGIAQAGRDVVLSAAGTVQNGGQVVAGRDMSVQAGRVDNTAAGALGAGGALTVVSAGALQNDGALQSGGELRMTAASLDQSGSAFAGNTLVANITGTLDNRGSLTAKNALQLDSGGLRSSGQLGSETAGVTLHSRGDLQLQGVVAAATTLQATAVGDLQQAGSLKAQSVALQAGRDLGISGTLQSASLLDLQAQRTLSMTGQASAAGNASLRGAQVVTGQAAVLQSGGAITMDGAAIDSRGALDAATDLTLRSTGDLAVAGIAQADRNVTLSATGALSNAAQVVAGQALGVTANSASNAATGVVLAQGSTTLAIGGLFDNAGAVRAGNQLSMNVGSLRQTGQAYGLQGLGLIAGGAVDNRGDLIGGNALRVEAAQLSSSGQLGSERGDVALISRGNLQLGGTLAAAGAFSAQADGALAQSGSVSAGSNVELHAKGDLNVAGQLGGQQITLNSDAVLRQQGVVSGTTVGLQGARIENAGQTTASGNLTLRAGEISIGGTVGAGIAGDGSLGNGSTLSVIADRQLTASGKLLAGGNLIAQGSQLQLAGASTRATGNASLTTGGDLDHRGGDLLAGGTLSLQAGGRIDNGLLGSVGGKLQANQISIDGGSLNNAGGQLVQSGSGATRVVIGGAFDNTGGTLASNGQDLTISAGSVENAQGRIEHAGVGSLSVTSRGALGNSGGRLVSQGQLSVGASAALNNQSGVIAAAGDAVVTAASLNNVGGSVAARGLTVQTTGAADNRNGLLQANGGALTLRADSLSNTGGTVHALANAGVGGGLRVELTRSLDNGNGVIGASNDAVITAENISSSGGSLQAGRDLNVTARGQLDNHQGGKLSAGRDLVVAATGALLNSGGQLDAGNALTASAGRIDNTQGSIVNNGGGLTRITTGGALTNTSGNLGGRGSVVIDAASIANNSGQLVAGGDLIANTSALNNQGGNVYAGANFRLERSGATLDNRNGKIKAEQSVRLNVQSLSNAGGQIGAGSTTGGAGDVVIDTVGFDGGGSILAQNLLDMTLRSDYTHRAGADLTSNGDFNLRVGGNLVNEATLKATRRLDITAGSITNRAGANIASNDTRLNGGGVIDNAGSISGNGALSLVANSINNTGSIVGGNVSVNTGTLVNGADLGGATDNAAYGSALLGSTGNMSLIVRDQLLNRDARIFSLGNIAIGGAQDGGGTLVARTGVVNNLSGSIEADGSILIGAGQINNRRRVINAVTGALSESERAAANAELPTQVLEAGGPIPENPRGENIGSGLFLGSYRTYDVRERERLISTSAESRIVGGRNIALSGSVRNTASLIAAGSNLFLNTRGVGGLSDQMFTNGEQVFNEALALKQITNYVDSQDLYVLDENTDCAQGIENRGCTYHVETTQIGSGTIDTSYTALGASMTGGQGVSINGANISNGAVGSDGRSVSGASLAAGGQQTGLSRRNTQAASAVATQAVIGRANGGAASIGVATGTAGNAGAQVGANTQDATLATSGSIVAMSIGPVMSNDSGLVRSTVDQANVQAGGATPGVAAGSSEGRTRVDLASIPVATVAGGGQTSLSQIDLPIGGLYRLSNGNGTDLAAMGRAANGVGGINAWRSNGPGRRYLIETDPRFVNYNNFISSDFLLDKLGVDPEWTQTRLGDGFYEQRLVLDQITQLTGRRYLGNYEDGVAQYRALLESGVSAAGQLQLSMGVGLTAAQAAALTQDIVWMVEQDYQGQKVLVPVVYLASNSLQLRGNGALIAGGNVELNATNSMSNQGVIAGADVSITAGNLLNQGRISGTGAVSLEARNDLLNQGQIQGRDVGLLAGNNLISEAAKAINGVGILSGISASNTLQMVAGNDMTLTGTRVQADGSAALIAGNNLSLTPSALRDDSGLLRGGDAVSVTTGQDLIVSAGNDLQLHGVTIKAGGSAALQAGNNLSLTPTTGLDGKVATRTTISTGDSLQLTAGNDLTIRQAEVKAGGDLIAAAGNNLNVESVLNESETNSYNSRNGKTRVTTTTTTQTVDQQALTAGGNLILSAGNDVNLVAAKLDAGKGLGISAGNDINASTLTTVDTSDTLETRKRFKQTTATRDETVYGTEFNAGGNLAMQAGNDITLTAATAASKDGAISLAAGNDVNLLAASEQHDAVQDMTKKKKGTFSSKTTTTHDEWQDNFAIGTALSGESVNISAGNDVAVVGSTVLGNGDVRLAAGNNVTIESAQDTSSEAHSFSQKRSGLTGGIGGGVASIGYSKARNNSENSSESVTQVASSVGSTDGNLVVSAGNQLTIAASDIGAGKDLTLAAKDIALLARQDTVESQSSQSSKSSGFSVGVTYDPGASYRSARDSTTKNMVDTGSTMSKMSRDAEGAAAGTMAAITPVVIQAGSHRSNASQNESTSDVRVSQLAAGGNLTLLASDGSITSQGAQMSAEGNALLLASKDIVFDVAHNTQSSGNASAGKGWGFNNAAGLPYGNYNQQGTGNGQTDTITGTQLSVGGNASLTTTQGDITLTASNIAAQGNVSMRAAGDLTIQSGQDILGNANQSTSKGIGTVVISDTERFAGYNKKNHTDDNAQVAQVASNVGSLGGNVSLTAGGTYTQSASNVVAAKDVDITAASIQLLTANQSSSASQQDDDLKIGAFARIKSPLIDLINNVDDARKSDGRLGAMQGMAAAANAYQSASAISSMAGGAGSGSLLSVEAGVGFATSESSFNSASQLSQGSTITGGGNVSLKTTEGDLRVVQGNIKSGDTLSLDSARDLVLEAGSSSNTEQSKGSNAGFEVGVGASVGAQTGVYAYVQASAGSHKSNVDGSTWQNTQLAGQNIVLKSEGDTTLRGAVVKGDRIDAQVGGDLTIESLQDKLDIQSKESSVGGRVQVSAGTAWDASGYASGAKANGNYLGVVEQSGLFAGNGGYHVTAGNVNLIGGAIASTNAGASELTADSLTFTDLKNQMDYSASSGSISGGFGSTGNQTDANGNPIQRTAGEQSSDIGNNIANGNYGKANTGSFMPGVPMSESGSDTSYTRATLTEGTIKIGGKTTTAAATGINTDATAAHEAVATLPDVRKILGEQQAMAAAAGTVMATGKQIGDDIAAAAESKTDAIEKQYKDGLSQEGKDNFAKLTADQRRDVLAQSNPEYSAAYEAKQQWGVGGEYSRALQAVTTALVGSVAGQGAGQIASNALAPYAAQLIGKTFDQNHGSDPNAVLQGLSHAVLGAVLAQVNGTSMAGGALAGAGGELAAQYLTKALYEDDPEAYGPDGKFDPNLLPEADKQMIVALSQAIGAIAGGMTGGSLGEAALAGNIAGNAAQNNHLSKGQEKTLNNELTECEKRGCTELDKKAIWEKWQAVSAFQKEEYAGLIINCDESSGGCPTAAYLNADPASGSGISLKGALGDTIRRSLSDDLNYTRFVAVSSVAGSMINGPSSNTEAASDILMDKITGVISSAVNRWISGSEPKGVGQLQSGYNPSEIIKPYTFVEIDGVSYPVYTYEEAKKLPPGKGAILTTQGGDQRVLQGQNSAAANYDAATPGAMSDVSTGQRLVFALRYDNNVNGTSVGGKGVNVVRFDGFDVDEGYLKPVDGKTNSYSMQDGTKFNRDVRRQQEALGQNGVGGIWEMPTTGKVNSTTRKLLREFPKNNIEVRERK